MRVRHVEDGPQPPFHRHSPTRPLSGCIGTNEVSGLPVRIAFAREEGTNILIVGRSFSVALGIFTVMLLDLTQQIISMPDRAGIHSTPPFSILDFQSNTESRVFTDTAMSLPLPVKLERATDTAMTSLSDLQYELARRKREPVAPRHSKFLFLCGLQAAHALRSRGFYAEPGINPAAAKFNGLLREGAGQGLHSIVWCNSFANIDLTLANALRHFSHVIVLDGAGTHDALPAEVSSGPADQGWYVEVEHSTATRLSPYALPSASWCDAAVRSMNRSDGTGT